MATNVILDVDTGVDDALALLLAAQLPELTVTAVTCVAGNVGVDQVVHNTLGVLEAAGASHIPVARGADRPLVTPPAPAAHVHGTDGVGGVVLPAATARPVPEHAVELMRSTIMTATMSTTIIALAPLTNVALLLRMYPEVIERLDRIVFMGGSASVGNAGPLAEFNVWHDPEAAAVVLDSLVPVTMYGLDVFYAVGVHTERINALGDHSKPGARLAAQLLGSRSLSVRKEFRQDPGVAGLGDAGAICVFVDPEGADLHRLPVEVSLTPGATRGQTVVDRRTMSVEPGDVEELKARLVDVVLAVDAERYESLFLRVVTSNQESFFEEGGAGARSGHCR